MQSFLEIKVLRPSLSETDSPFCKISERTGPLEEEIFYLELSAWELLHHPEKNNFVSVEFISEDTYRKAYLALVL